MHISIFQPWYSSQWWQLHKVRWMQFSVTGLVSSHWTVCAGLHSNKIVSDYVHIAAFVPFSCSKPLCYRLVNFSKFSFTVLDWYYWLHRSIQQESRSPWHTESPSFPYLNAPFCSPWTLVTNHQTITLSYQSATNTYSMWYIQLLLLHMLFGLQHPLLLPSHVLFWRGLKCPQGGNTWPKPRAFKCLWKRWQQKNMDNPNRFCYICHKPTSNLMYVHFSFPVTLFLCFECK